MSRQRRPKLCVAPAADVALLPLQRLTARVDSVRQSLAPQAALYRVICLLASVYARDAMRPASQVCDRIMPGYGEQMRAISLRCACSLATSPQ